MPARSCEGPHEEALISLFTVILWVDVVWMLRSLPLNFVVRLT